MIKRFEEIIAEYKQVEQDLMNPEIINNQSEYIKKSKKLSQMKSVVEVINKYKDTIKQRDDALELVKDPEMKELAQIELDEAKTNIPIIEEEIKILLLPKDPNDDRNVIVEIRPAA